jgi:hypothetical protein
LPCHFMSPFSGFPLLGCTSVVAWSYALTPLFISWG